jgi:hypothetical protein
MQQWESCDKLKALTFAFNKISNFIESFPPGFTGEEHMIDMMCTKVLANEKWVEDVCTRRLTDDTVLFANNNYVPPCARKYRRGELKILSTAQTELSTYIASIPFGEH